MFSDLSNVAGWRGGGGLLGKILYTCHVQLLVGFCLCPVFPVCLMYIFSSCLQDTVTHISGLARDKARGAWGRRTPVQKWPNFSRLMSDATYHPFILKYKKPHLPKQKQEQGDHSRPRLLHWLWVIILKSCKHWMHRTLRMSLRRDMDAVTTPLNGFRESLLSME